MKCPKCGFITSELKVQCMRCGSSLPGRKEDPAHVPDSPPAPVVPPPVPAAEVPEWRRQVTQSVREFGERKKLLTTPPNPLRPSIDTPSEPFPEIETGSRDIDPSPPAPPPVVEPPLPPPVAAPSAPPPPRQILPPVDLSVDDLIDMEVDPLESPQEPPPRLLFRRACSLLLDSIVLIVLHAGLIYLVSQIISHPFEELVRAAWIPLVSIFLLFHYVYYAYFYKTSRQTPGQVFVAIELRDPLSSRISLVKITIRWLCLILLNILNLVPVLFGKSLLLDLLSGTEIRSLK